MFKTIAKFIGTLFTYIFAFLGVAVVAVVSIIAFNVYTFIDEVQECEADPDNICTVTTNL